MEVDRVGAPVPGLGILKIAWPMQAKAPTAQHCSFGILTHSAKAPAPYRSPQHDLVPGHDPLCHVSRQRSVPCRLPSGEGATAAPHCSKAGCDVSEERIVF